MGRDSRKSSPSHMTVEEVLGGSGWPKRQPHFHLLMVQSQHDLPDTDWGVFVKTTDT